MSTSSSNNNHFQRTPETQNDDGILDVIEVCDSVSNITNTRSKSRAVSTVWMHFTCIPDQKKEKCNICLKLFSYNGATTSNLLSHLKSHKELLDNEGKLKESTTRPMIQQDIRSSISSMHKQFSDELFSDHLVNFFVKQDKSFSMIESQQFCDLIKLLHPTAKLYGADTLKRRVMERFEEEFAKKKQEIQRQTGKISFTTDIWTSPMQVPVMAVTAHYIDSYWKLHSTLLDFVWIPGRHGGVRICNTFEEVLKLYEITHNVLGITLDNASNNDKFIKTLIGRGKLQEEYHFCCFPHVINLAVQGALGSGSAAIVKLQLAIRAIRMSPLKLERLSNICETLNPMVWFVKPILDVPTRWNSTVDMLERACSLKRALIILFAEMDEHARHDEDFTFEYNDWKVYENFNRFLSIFKTATKMASADKYPSLSLVVPLYNSLLDHTESVILKSGTSKDLVDAAEACKAKLLAYYDVTSDACTIATVLDPRLKLEYYRQDNDNSSQVRVEDIYNMVNGVFSSNYEPREEVVAVDTDSVPNDQFSITKHIFKKRKISAVSEFKEYCASGIANKDTNPLEWWKNNARLYPNLARMARDYLAIPGSSTSSERAFSSGRQTITDFCCSLSPLTIKACQCLKSWL